MIRVPNTGSGEVEKGKAAVCSVPIRERETKLIWRPCAVSPETGICRCPAVEVAIRGCVGTLDFSEHPAKSHLAQRNGPTWAWLEVKFGSARE